MGSHGKHNIGHIVVAVLTTVALILTMIFTFLADSGKASIFKNSTDGISEGHHLDITPSSGGTLSLWVVIYLWQLAWLGYGLSTIGREGFDGYIYISPNVLPMGIYIFFMLSNLLVIGWLFLWDHKVFIATVIFSALATFTLYVSIFLSHWTLSQTQGTLLKFRMKTEIWLIRVLVQNGLAFYATWMTVLTLLNLATCISYTGSLAQDKSSTIALAILAVEILVWFAVDNFVLDRFVRYNISPYIAMVWVISGMIDRNYTSGNRNSIFAAVLLAVVLALLVAKVVLMFWRHFRDPLHRPPVGEVGIQSGYDVKIAANQRAYKVNGERDDQSAKI